MKKILFFASVLAGFFLAASCQQESFEPEVSCNVVSYTIQVPGAIGTKAIGTDVTAVTELIYEVYRIDEQGAETKLYQKSETRDAANGETNWTVELELVNNQDFRVLFWAQVPGNGVYTTGNLKAVELSTTLSANAEKYAAFAGQDVINHGDRLVGRTITLKRPVAQLNIATSAESLKLGEDENGANAQTTVTFETTAVTVEGLSTVYNVADQSVSATTTTFVYGATLPYDNDATTTDNLSEATIKVNNVDYQYVSMNYVGFAQPSGDNVEVTYTIETNEVGTITNTISNVPVKANYRTNIIGNLITSTSDYTVTLSATWPTDEEKNVEVVAVSTAADLQEAINSISDGAEGNIKLEGDINLNDLVGLLSTKAAPAYGLLIPETKTVVLDLGGYTLTGNAIVDGSKVHVIVNNGTLTIMNGTLTANGTNGGSAISNNGILTITDATVNGASSDTATGTASYAVNSQGTESKLVVNNSTINGRGVIGATKGTKVEINGGTYHTPAVAWGHAVYADGEGTEVVINDGTFSEGYETSATNWGMYQIYSGDKAKVIVNSGDFSQPWDCANGYDLCTATEGTIVIYGGSFAENPSNQNGINYVADGYGVVANENGTFTVEKLPTAAKIGDTEYLKLAEAVNNVKEGETITILEGTIEEGTIKLPASLKNVTFKGEEGAILKDMTIMAHDGNSISYEGLTFEGLTFENSRISITGWRTNGAVVKNFTVTNCIFRNLDDNTNSAPVHFNMDTHEAVNGFTFTDNVIDGATGGAKSGIYIATTGNVIINNNTFNNIVFRPALVQLADCDGVEDNVQISDNVISNTTRLQVYGSEQDNGDGTYTPVGTDKLTIAINNNIFKNITTSYYICTWGINGDSDITDNYFDGDISGRIFWNNEKPSDVTGLIAIGIYPIYTELNSDGTINKDSSYTPSTVAKIGDVEYYSLQEAVDVAETGATIIFLKDIEQVDGVLITDKNLTVDLNEKTFTVSEGANTNNRNFKINGSSVVTIKNGTMVANGDINSGTYGTVRTEDSAEVTLNDVKAYSYRGYGLNVKACTGTKITINDSEIYAQYSGGVEAAGGEIELNNVKIVQNGVDSSGAWCSVAIGVNGGGKVTVNSGEYSAAAISTDSNAAQGTWVAYVMSSGGTLDIKGGTFNGTVAETAAAANACGLICADTKAVVNIYEGTFTSNGAILDMRNNTGATPNPVATLYGGNFSADPRVSGLYSSNLISVAEGMEVKEGADGRWILVKVQPNNEIWYTSDEMKLEPTTPNAFNANIVSNVWDSTTGKGVITFDAPLTTIGNEAFKRITNNTPSNWMTSISLPNSLETIGDYAFYQCFSLTSITIPDSVTSIGQYAFGSCRAATTVTIGSGVTSIASGAFYELWELKDFICKPTTPPTLADKWVFSSSYRPDRVIVPAGSVDAYKAANFWKDLNIVTE